MEVVYFLCVVAVITIGLLCLVGRSGRNSCQSRKTGVAGAARAHRPGSTMHAVPYPPARHTAAAGKPDIWHTHRQHAAEKARLTSTLQATHILFDHEPAAPAAPADDLSMTAVEYIPEEMSGPSQRRN